MNKAITGSRGAGLVLGAALLWGTIGPSQVLGGGDIDPAALAGWRHVVGGLALCGLALRDPAGLRRLRERRVWTLVVLAGVVGAVYQVSFLTGVSLAGAAMGTVLGVATVPLFCGLAARWFDGQRLTRSWLIGSGLAVAGSCLLLAPAAGAEVEPAGLACGLAAGALFAGYTTAAKRLGATGIPVYAGTGAGMLVGALVLTPAMASGIGALAQPRVLTVIAWLGLVTTGAAYAMYGAGLRSVSTGVAGTLSLGEPLAAALLSTTLLGESLTVAEVLACAAILTGLLITSRVTGPAAAPLVSSAVGVVAMPVRIPLRPDLVGRPHPLGRGVARPGEQAEPTVKYTRRSLVRPEDHALLRRRD
ncbi:DMT family transporter [Actinoplanes sp. NPDC051494]|uniref:DMT family transporter n=1 Tax=Actinoplanes sp. NPDC051494 TaxID=3363907 RepID=UPI0037A1D605